MSIRLLSWNINSVRLRAPLLARVVRECRPDIVCLQETKVEDSLFPADALRDMGFAHLIFSGQKSYNGVAIASRIPLSHVTTLDLLGNGEKRHISATLPDGTQLHNLYVPAGGDIPDVDQNPKFRDKLAYMDAITDYAARQLSADARAIIVGDLNIAPLEHDVWSHKQLLDVVSHTPVEVERMARLKATRNWVDTHREHVSASEKLYSWWSYRARDWEASNRGRRLDHIWITPALAPSLRATAILREVRGWEQPSDHAPIFADLDMPELSISEAA